MTELLAKNDNVITDLLLLRIPTPQTHPKVNHNYYFVVKTTKVN